MRGVSAVVFVLGACGFHSGAPPAIPPPQPDAAEDAPVDVALDGPAGFCDPSDPHLVVCYELEGDTRDGSAHHLDATAVNVTFPEGKVGKAMRFGPSSAADVTDSELFDVATLTIEAWVRPSQMPASGSRAGIVDMNAQYSMFLSADGDLSCTLVGGASPPTTAAGFAVDRWSHVACTYDGSVGTMYVNGISISSADDGGELHTSGADGISLAADNPPGSGLRLNGLIDQVRIFDIARTADEICRDADRADCPSVASP